MDSKKGLIEKENVAKAGLWRRWYKWILVLVVIVALVSGGIYFWSANNKEVDEVGSGEEELPEVLVESFANLVDQIKLERIATIKPATGAPLVARAGGRVSAIDSVLGEEVIAGQVVVSIDSGVEANPARAQLAAVQSSLVVIDDIEREALRAAENAVQTAKLAVDAARAGRSLTASQVAKSEETADLSVRQAELSYEDAIESEERMDQVVRAADIGLQAAKLAQDQAQIAKSIANRRASDGLKQAEQGLRSARDAKGKIKVDIQSQRVSLQGQLATATEQIRLAQVISPVKGQITRLTVKQGDYIRPGQEVGEVIAFEGAQIQLDVATGVRERLRIGDSLDIKSQGQVFKGEVVRLADGPRTDMALWQVDIFVAGTPKVVHPGDLVVVELPVGRAGEDSSFLPLDAVVVRQDGIVLMTVEEGKVREHVVRPISYSGDYIEAKVDVWDSAAVIVEGNRTLRAGDLVQVKS